LGGKKEKTFDFWKEIFLILILVLLLPSGGWLWKLI